MIIWKPEGHYKNLLEIFCNMRDRDLLQITQGYEPDGAMFYELEPAIAKPHLFLRYLNYLLRTRL